MLEEGLLNTTGTETNGETRDWGVAATQELLRTKVLLKWLETPKRNGTSAG